MNFQKFNQFRRYVTRSRNFEALLSLPQEKQPLAILEAVKIVKGFIDNERLSQNDELIIRAWLNGLTEGDSIREYYTPQPTEVRDE